MGRGGSMIAGQPDGRYDLGKSAVALRGRNAEYRRHHRAGRRWITSRAGTDAHRGI